MSMNRSQHKAPNARRLWTTVFILWLCVVWGHSLMPGEASSLESSRFVFLLRPLFALFGNTDERLMSFIIRKTAHFTEYAILLSLGTKMAQEWFGRSSKKTYALVLAIWVLAPCIDECIQLTTPGRAGMPTDVLIDMAGGLTGHLLQRLVWHIKKNDPSL